MDHQEENTKKEYNTIGNKIRLTRKKLGLTQEELAERTDLHYSYIGQVERGDKNPSLNSLQKMAAALNVGIEFLLEENSDYEIDEAELLQKELWKLLRNRPKEDLQLLVSIARVIFGRLDKLQD